VRATRALLSYFNGPGGFQTYDRRVHVYVQIGGSNATPQTRRQDAAEAISFLHPFAVLDQASIFGYDAEYDGAMAAGGVEVFASPLPAITDSLAADAPYRWSYWTDTAHRAALYSSYVCTKIVPYPVAHSGAGPVWNSDGKPRTYGFLYTTDPSLPEVKAFVDTVRPQLHACGVDPVATGTFPYGGFIVDGHDNGQAQLQDAKQFQAQGVTTILWLGGEDSKFTEFAASLAYFPEIVLAGDNHIDSDADAYDQDPLVWRNAWAVSLQPRLDDPRQAPGSQAASAGDPNLDKQARAWASTMYEDYFLLFLAIQSAGADLNPDSVDQGLHAFPPSTAGTPYVTSCYFDPGDYSCVKDATEKWWDPAGRLPHRRELGCWRLVADGRRFTAGTWTASDDVFGQRSDPCSAGVGTSALRPT
jgi:hypothetical protein